MTGWDDLVVSLHIPVVKLVEPEAIFLLPVVVQIRDSGQMLYVAFASQGCEWTSIGVHRSKYDSCILNSSAYIFRSIIPVYSDCINWRGGVVAGMKEFHYAGEVVGFARRLTNQICVVYDVLESEKRVAGVVTNHSVQ